MAKGLSQTYGQMYPDTFSPSIGTTVIRSLFAIAAHHGLKMRHTDAKTAILNSSLEDENFNKLDCGLASGERIVCKLNK